MDATTKNKIAEFICGDLKEKHPIYRSSFYLSKFFQEVGINEVHDGSSRNPWTSNVINRLNGVDLQKVIIRLASPKLYGGDREKIQLALRTLNEILMVEGLKISIEGVNPILSKIVPNYNFEETSKEDISKFEFLPPPNFDFLNFEFGLAEILKKRWVEINNCIENDSPIGAIILMGSVLEGILLGMFQKNPRIANSAKNVPKQKDGSVKYFADWTLNEMIDVAHEIGWIQLDVKKFSHVLRDFRNVVHPYHQLSNNFNPDIDTCKISWMVIQASFNDIKRWIGSSKSNV